MDTEAARRLTGAKPRGRDGGAASQILRPAAQRGMAPAACAPSAFARAPNRWASRPRTMPASQSPPVSTPGAASTLPPAFPRAHPGGEARRAASARLSARDAGQRAGRDLHEALDHDVLLAVTKDELARRRCRARALDQLMHQALQAGVRRRPEPGALAGILPSLPQAGFLLRSDAGGYPAARL